MIKNGAEIKALEAKGYRVVVLGKGESDSSVMYRVRKGSRGHVAILDECGLLELSERAAARGQRGLLATVERAALERRGRAKV